MRNMTPLHGWALSVASLATMCLLAPVDPFATGLALYHMIDLIALVVTISL